MTTAKKLTLNAVPPFDFDLSALIFSSGDGQIRKYEDGKFWQVMTVDDYLVLVVLRSLGTIDRPGISVELRSSERLSTQKMKKAQEILTALFNLNLNLLPFYEEVKDDSVMSIITQKLRGLKNPTTPTVYEALVDSIIEQQISLDVAHILETKLIRAFGDSLELDGKRYFAYPTPQRLASINIEKIRRCGLSLKKAEYIKGISKLIRDGDLDLERYKRYTNASEIIHELDEIRGIGVWTAELTMVRGMQKLEAMPADDLGLRRVISHFYCDDKKISSEEARRIAVKWGKWKGLASYYLVVAEAVGLTDD